MPPGRRRVVVTGIGLVTPCGVGREPAWESIVAGRSGIGPVTRFDASALSSRIAGEVHGLEPAHVVSRRDAGTLDLFEVYALAAAKEAVDDAALDVDGVGAERVGAIMGVGLGGIGTMERYHRALLDRGPRRVSPYLVPMMIPNMAASHLSMRFGARGPCQAVASACASGAHAVGEGAGWIRQGVADVVLAGGAEAAVTALSMAGFCSMRALSTRNEEPERASRPFDARRDGFVLSEGAAVLVLEEAETARGRGARVYAELAGYGSTADAFHVTQPEPDGTGQRRCMEIALADACVAPQDVGYINAHGTSTPQNDHAEAAAIRGALGDHGSAVPVSSTKSVTGHLLGAAGALEAALCALAIDRGVLPPTMNLDEPDPTCLLRHVAHEAMEAEVGSAMSNSFGFGGTNATLVLRRIGAAEES